MVKTLTLSFEDKEFKQLYIARDIHDAKSWEKFILAVCAEWYEAKKERVL